MIVEVRRTHAVEGATLGGVWIDGEWICYALEDPVRPPGQKIYGRTAIPPGVYRVELRRAGGMHARYTERFGSWHAGMLWLRGVPDYEWVYIHIGNDPDDTEGCIVVASTSGPGPWVGQSTPAYRALYPPVRDAIQSGEPVVAVVRDVR